MSVIYADGLFSARIMPHYQPVFSRDGGILFRESLIRISKGGRIFSPLSLLKWISRQEGDASRSLDLFDLLLRQSVADLPVLGAPISLNVRPELLVSERFLRTLLSVEKRGSLIVEIIESPAHFPRGERALSDACLELRRAGVRLALDDFGVANSNLDRVVDLGIDIIKVDSYFLRSPRAVLMLRPLVALCHEVGAEAVIEGIETPEQFEIAKLAGFDGYQGYLLAPPAPIG